MFKEEEILAFWEKNNIFERSVNKRKGKKHFVFYEGPPTANGQPGVHHVEARAFKDVVLRYKTMKGFYIPRRAGWDTHGLQVEVEVEKTLGLKNKKDIERYGVTAFNKKCRESVWKYKEFWERMTKRMGFWIDMAHPYITYENSYIKSLWWIIKEFTKKKYLYEDYKVVPWCARCGTALSSHELALGYEKIKEDSIYVKFPAKGGSASGGKIPENTFFLVWTTTPWTLPGNIALAVNPKIGYVMLEVGGEKLVLAESRISILDKDYKILKKIKGSDIVGLEYEPFYGVGRTAYSVVAGDFVSTEDGTGIVHIAPAFGDDDFQLSKKYDLPVLATTNAEGAMQAPGRAWNGIWFKKADKMIVENLKSRGLLFKTESYEHDYPFCWRCKNPLMYLARKTWWVDVNAVRPKLLENNQKINWHPEHLKDGRMGEWLKEKKNWAFSRERYWGTPLPVWRCEKCHKWEAIGSIEELKKRSQNSGNKYFIMRHGQSENNVENILNSDLAKNHYHLTSKGKKQVETAAQLMLKKKIKPDLIFTSPFLRAEESAGLIAKILSIGEQNIKIDPRLSEDNMGIFSGESIEKYHAYFTDSLERFSKAAPKGESLTMVKNRMWSVISELESKYQNKTILIVSHDDPLWMLWAAANGKTNEKSIKEQQRRKYGFIKTGAFEELKFNAIPRDESLVLDLHKPFIDKILIGCSCGAKMRRVPEVVDAWFDSGAMPFAGDHYPFQTKKLNYPADYIVEAVDQTRGWFYSLLAVGTLLGRGASYKNAISLGHVLDAKGKKMSKSLGNITEPMALIERYGADPVRWYFFTINQPWDSKLFKEEDIKDASRRFFMILWNVLQFWKIYGGKSGKVIKPKLLINQWAMAKLADTTNSVTKKLDNYDIVGAARDLESFVVEDISRWYIRRIRDVMKENSQEAKETSAVLTHLLGEVSKLLAPFAPFISEKIWMELLARRSLGVGGGNKNSVHLEDWPKAEKLSAPNKKLLQEMKNTRKIVGFALEARAKTGIRVRQPLAKIETKIPVLAVFVKDEVNVKDVVVNIKLQEDVRLDTKITPELREEGILRDLIREIQAARKEAGLKPKDKVTAQISMPKEILEVAKKNEKVLMKETNLKSLQFSESPETKISLK